MLLSIAPSQNSTFGCQGDVLSRESGEVLQQLPRDAPSLEVFKTRLGGTLGSLV